MCRLLGIVSSEHTEFRIVLREAPRSLAALSRHHPDGWGIAVYDGDTDWRINKGVLCASEDEEFHQHAVGSRGMLMLSHIRQRTVGPTSIENTHPFRHGRWVFAHNGTIKATDWLRNRTSPDRLRELEGQTDSELFFAYLLTQLDAAHLVDSPISSDTDGVIARATAEARNHPEFGAFNFLLSDGTSIYAHRFGRTLCLLERGPDDEVRQVRSSRDGTIVQTPWSQRRRAILVASEHLTDEPWQDIADGMLLRIDRLPLPQWRILRP